MKLAGRIPVEPLDDERLTNLERRVVASAVDAAIRGHDLRAQHRVLAGALVAAALVAAGFVGWALHGAPTRAPVVAEPAPLRVHSDRERSVLDIGDAVIESDPATAFTVTRPDGGVLVAMARGKVELEVGKRGASPPLIVRAGATDVVVVGTHFTVDYGDGRGEVDVRVREGVVRVVHQQQETRVAAGEAWHTRTGLVASADREAGHDAPPPESGSGGAGAEPRSIPVGDARIALAPTPDVLHDHKAVVPDAPAAAAPAPRSVPLPARSTDAAVRPRAAARSSDPLVDLRTAVRAQRVEPALGIQERDPARAVARYYSIAAHTSGDEASQAFYSIAVVQHLKLGLAGDALRTLDAYIHRFPGGKEYHAALWLRVRILCLGKIDDRCRAAAYTYLQEAPGDPAAQVAERLTLAE